MKPRIRLMTNKTKVFTRHLIRLLIAIAISSTLVAVPSAANASANSTIDSQPIWLEFLSILLPAIAVVVTIAFGTIFARREYRQKFLSQEWSSLMRFLLVNAEYMDREKNRNYRTAYEGVDVVRYELVARICIAYVDDMYFMDFAKSQADWMVGAIPLFIGTHAAWFRDHPSFYAADFYASVCAELTKGDY